MSPSLRKPSRSNSASGSTSRSSDTTSSETTASPAGNAPATAGKNAAKPASGAGSGSTKGADSADAPTIKEARQLCTAAELSLVMKSRSRESASPATLAKALDRARKLRDKFRDLAASQRRAGRGKGRGTSARSTPGGPSSVDANARTSRKAEIFADVMRRFEAKLEERGSVGKAKKSARSAKASRKAKTAASVKAPQASRQRVRRALSMELEAGSATATDRGTGVRGGRSAAAKASKKGGSASGSAAGGAGARTTAKPRETGKRASAAAPRTAKKAASRSPSSESKTSGAKAMKSTPKAKPTRTAGGSGERRTSAAKKKTSRIIEALPIATPATALAAAGFDATLAGIVGRQAKIERRGKRVAARMRETNAPKIHGHVAARGRRNQAKRDARGR